MEELARLFPLEIAADGSKVHYFPLLPPPSLSACLPPEKKSGLSAFGLSSYSGACFAVGSNSLRLILRMWHAPLSPYSFAGEVEEVCCSADAAICICGDSRPKQVQVW